MKKRFALIIGLTFLLVAASDLWATINQIDGPKCNGVAAVRQGMSQNFYIQGVGVDLTTGLSVGGSGVTATIVRRWTGAQNQADGGNILWGKIQIKITASSSAAVGNHTVTIKYLVGEDKFTIRVIRKASITGASVPTFSQPFQSNVDVRLTGTGLSNANQRASIRIIRDAYHPLLDSGSEEVQDTVTVTGAVNTSTNTDTQADVRLNFSERLTKATISIGLSPLSNCSGLPGGYTLTLTAPLGGPNYVKSHKFDYQTYAIGQAATVEIKLDRPVSTSGVPITRPQQPLRKPSTQRQALGETVYWAVIPSNAVQYGGASAAPYDPNARYNQITIPFGKQVKAVSFIISPCTSGTGNINRTFVTWKPNSSDDSAPNRKQTAFTVRCR